MPIAKIVPLSSASDFDAEELALAAAGRLRLPEKRLPDSFWTPRVKKSRILLKRLVESVVADREERDKSLLGR